MTRLGTQADLKNNSEKNVRFFENELELKLPIVIIRLMNSLTRTKKDSIIVTMIKWYRIRKTKE